MRIVFIAAAFLLGSCVPMPRYTAKGDRSIATVRDRHQEDNTSQNQRTEKSNSLIHEIDSWLGTPYRFGAVEKGKGTDCSGFVGEIMQRVYGLTLPREANEMYGQGVAIDQRDLRQGDLVFFQKTYKGSVGASHVGIFIEGDRFAHASTTVGVTYSNLSEPYYRNHFLGCRRVLK